MADVEHGMAHTGARGPLSGVLAEVALRRLRYGLQPGAGQQYRAVGGLLEDGHFVQVAGNSAHAYRWWRLRAWLYVLLSLLPIVPPACLLLFVIHMGDVSTHEGSMQERQTTQLHAWYVLCKVGAAGALGLTVVSALVGAFIAWYEPRVNIPLHASERLVGTVRYCQELLPGSGNTMKLVTENTTVTDKVEHNALTRQDMIAPKAGHYTYDVSHKTDEDDRSTLDYKRQQSACLMAVLLQMQYSSSLDSGNSNSGSCSRQCSAPGLPLLCRP